MPKLLLFPILIIFLSSVWTQISFAGKYDDSSSFPELYRDIQHDLQTYLESEHWVPELTNLPNGLQVAANIESNPEPSIVAAQLIAQRVAQSFATLAAQGNIGYRDADISTRSYKETRRLMSLAVVYMARYAELQGRTASFPLRDKFLKGAFWTSVISTVVGFGTIMHSPLAPLVQSLPPIALLGAPIFSIYATYLALWGVIDLAAFERDWMRRIFNNKKGREIAAVFIQALEEALKPFRLSLRRQDKESDQDLIRRILEMLERPQPADSDNAQVCSTFLLSEQQLEPRSGGVRVGNPSSQEVLPVDEALAADVQEENAGKRQNH